MRGRSSTRALESRELGTNAMAFALAKTGGQFSTLIFGSEWS